MKYQFAFRQMASSEDLIHYTTEKMDRRLNLLTKNPLSVNFTISHIGKLMRVRCLVHSGKGTTLMFDQYDPDAYTAVDLLLDKLDRRLRKQKDMHSHHNERSFRHHNWSHTKGVE